MTFDWWTFAIQAINVLILIWILHRFFWKPISRVIMERRSATEAALENARVQTQAAEQARSDVEAARAGISREHDAMLETARKEAEKLSQSLLDDAAKQAEHLQDKAKADIKAAYVAARKAAMDEAGTLAIGIAAKLAARLEGSVVRAVFLESLVAEITALPANTRQSVAMRNATLRLTSATVLQENEEADCRRRIADAFGFEPDLAIVTDPALIEGLELHGEHFSILNSWRADLARIEESLSHD
ncbi:ATP synthase F0 subcomplex B subunit [Breoghania corrubedonensis]|uniref:ATP synthase subunit b n=1 Tax=Breoghania corrubedonensis TaxID=665038 RepID=A0A2T5VBG2_9HYPH|nr:ATP synthase F0 subunit B [Breoghania corrubedonensis]PTW61081.1 ATP synthase F0 subcomplex B subunit [Breoghania corrubedonensis]